LLDSCSGRFSPGETLWYY